MKPKETGYYLAKDGESGQWDVYYFDGREWAVKVEVESLIVWCAQDAIVDFVPVTIALDWVAKVVHQIAEQKRR